MTHDPNPGRWDDAPGRAPQAKRFDLLSFEEVRIATAPSYTIKGLLPHAGMAVFWGPPKCGKSFLVADLALHVALGWPYRGRRVQQGPVVYCALEGAQGFVARLAAFRQTHLSDDADPVPFFLSPTPMSLVADHAALIAGIRSRLGSALPRIVVVDTVNRSLTGSESSDADMSAYIRAADALRDAFGCLILLVHHCGLDASRPRGHTSLTGALDTQIAVKREDDGSISARVEYMKDGPEGGEVHSRLEVVEIGQDDEGDPITTCVIRPVDTPAEPAAKPTGKSAWGGNGRLLKDALERELLDHGKLLRPFGFDGPEVKAVPLDSVKTEFIAAYPGIAETAVRTFRREMEKAAERKLLATREIPDGGARMVWLASTTH